MFLKYFIQVNTFKRKFNKNRKLFCQFLIKCENNYNIFEIFSIICFKTISIGML